MFIIAEVGSNAKNIDDCLHSVERAKSCGADAVKFQMFSHKDLYGYGSEDPMAFKSAWLDRVASECEELEIEFMCTAFSVPTFHKIDPYVNYHKIASSDACDPFMLDVARETSKPFFVSTGGKTMSDIEMLVDECSNSDHLHLMYCESAYPASVINREKFESLKDFRIPLGFSDHSTNIYPLVDCEFYEKHVNFCGYEDTPDAPHSLSEADFRRFVRYCYNGYEFRTDHELPMYLFHNKRLIFTKNVKEGEELIFGENYGVYRSKISNNAPVSPRQWELFNKKIAVKDGSVGEPVSYKHIRIDL